MKLYVILSAVLLMFFSPLRAHGDLDERIEAVNVLIKSYPDSAALYFKRGKLKFQHEEYQASINDINESIAKGFDNELQNIYLAKALFKIEKYEHSFSKVSSFLQQDSNHVVALNLKGRILYAQGKYEASAESFEKVIHLSIRSLPENYLEAANAWSLSSHPNKYYKTTEILELGIKKLGPIITIQDRLIEIHMQYNHGKNAIATQMEIIDNKRRKESALFKLAELYIQLDKPLKAKKAASMANDHLEKLPLRIQKNAAMQSLKMKIQQLITNY